MSKKNREGWDEIVEANATLIVRAVNAYADPRIVTDNSRVNADLLAERDRLRDLVRRFADYVETFHSFGVQGAALIREARAAIGENK
jgi:hypothetical protein